MKKNALVFLFSVFSASVFALPADTNKTDANGKKQGHWIKRDEKGKVIYEGNFVNDKPIGEFKYYWDNSNLKAHSFYSDNGKVCRAKMFFYDGATLMAEGKYIDQI